MAFTILLINYFNTANLIQNTVSFTNNWYLPCLNIVIKQLKIQHSLCEINDRLITKIIM